MRMRDIIGLIETAMESSPADAAADEIFERIDPEWGDVVTSTLSDSAHSDRSSWSLKGDDVLVIDQIESSEKGQGYGKQMMQVVCAICDKHSVRIFLDADPYDDGLPRTALLAFYSKFGFVRCPEMAGRAMGTPLIREPR